MREFEPHSSELSGSLLLAHPGLRDSNFMSSVVFLSMHSAEDGAFGVVLNRPSGRRLNELMPGQELGLLSMVPVHIGGPVAQDQILLAAFCWNETINSWGWRHDLTIETATELVQQEGAILRVFAGYSGWSKGQLEKELESQTWVVHRPDADILEPDAQPDLWRNLIRTHGPVYRFLTENHPQLGLN